MFAAVEYLAAVVVTVPDAALADGPSDDPVRPGPVVAAEAFRSEVMSLAMSLCLASDFQLCDHSRAGWLPEIGIWACPDCQAQRGGEGDPWSL